MKSISLLFTLAPVILGQDACFQYGICSDVTQVVIGGGLAECQHYARQLGYDFWSYDFADAVCSLSPNCADGPDTLACLDCVTGERGCPYDLCEVRDDQCGTNAELILERP